jgi:glycosyltransferase involved in cell wall biosynthesis
VKIWYDVSDLVGWKLAHLTGIQRTTVGILNGLIEQGDSVGLVLYDAKAGRFSAISASELPANVRCHLRGFAAAESGASAAEVDKVAAPASPLAEKAASRPARRKLKLFKKGFFFGDAGETEEFRNAFRQFKTAARQLRKSIGHLAKRRLRRAARPGQQPAPPPHMGRAGQHGTPPVEGKDVAAFAAPGDVLMSIGATWVMPGHTNAVANVRCRGVKVVRMIYDLIPTIKPQWLEPAHTKSITAWVRSVLCESDCVLTISEFSRQEIERYCAECRFDVPPITVVRLGDVLGDASGSSTPAPLPRFAPTRPFFVCVSTLDVRKNHRLLYDAWTQLAAHRGEQCPDLVCIGTPHLYVTDLLREIRQDRTVNRHIHVLHGIEDCELEWYYKNCQSTIYPSKYEGWGLPVAESLGHGRLCLASNATSIPEISSDLPEFFDPYDVHGLVALVERVLDDPDWVREREATIRETFRPTSWRETAAQVLDAIRAPAGRGGLSAWPRVSPGAEGKSATVTPYSRSLEVA